jgi:Cu+-exporting ATPase
MRQAEQTVNPLTRDPVCGRHIGEAQALLRAEHKGRTYLFCSERCRMLFALRPDSFAVGEARPEVEEPRER